MTDAAETRRRDTRILVLGASGLIGHALATDLARRGFTVIAQARRFTEGQTAALASSIALERPIVEITAEALAALIEEHRPDLVVNTIGVLQDGPGSDAASVHQGFVGRLRFVARRDLDRRFYFTAIQSPFGRRLAISLGIDPENPDTNAVILDGAVHLRSDSALAVLGTLPGWRWTRCLKPVPKSLRDLAYRLIARNRYRLFGRNRFCVLADPAFDGRILHD